MTNRINPNPNYYSLAAKKRQKEVEERMALLNKIKEDADKHNMSYGKYILNILKLLIPDDLLSFLFLFFGVIPMIIYSSVYIYTSYLDFNYAKQNIMEYYQKNNAYPKDISQLDKENLVNINGNMYIYNKDTNHLIKYIPIISNQGKIIKFVIKRYDINCNFIDDFYESEVFNL